MKIEKDIPRYSIPESGTKISTFPDLDTKRAEHAVYSADMLMDTIGLDSDSPRWSAIHLASTLSLYNHSSYSKGVNGLEKRATKEVLKDRLIELALIEEVASHDLHPLPTIGVEIEVPRKPYQGMKGIYFEKFAPFFDTIGMPRNSQNVSAADILEEQEYFSWEFSPPPSYTAAVQNRIMSELIRGRFIPSLNTSNPASIHTFLDEKLVSLHANIGVPHWAQEHYSIKDPQWQTFGGAMTLGYSSKERIEHRRSKESYFVVEKKDAQNNNKTMDNIRAEIKGLEVRTMDSYRALYTAQLLAAAFFINCSDLDSPLSEVWDNLSVDLINLYNNYAIDVDAKTYDVNMQLANLDPSAARTARSILEKHAAQARRIITNSGELQLPLEA